MEKAYKLTWLERDALREIASIGLGNAATAISKLMARQVNVTILWVNLVRIQEASRIIGDPEQLVVAIHTKIKGDAAGSLLLLFDKVNALLMVDTLLGKEIGTTRILTENDRKTLVGVGNIISEAYLNSISQFLAVKLTHTPLQFTSDMANAIMGTVFGDIAQTLDHVLVYQLEFNLVPTSVKGRIVLVFDMQTTDRLVKAIHEKIKGK